MRDMRGRQVQRIDLPDMTLQPGEARELAIHDLMTKYPEIPDINLVYSYTGSYSDILEGTGSTDSSGNYVFPIVPQPVARSGAIQSNYWLFGGGYDTMYTVWNPLDTPQDLLATLRYGKEGASYRMFLQLDPHASAMIDIGVLARNRQPDVDGNVIPLDYLQGTLEISSTNDDPEDFMTAILSGGIYNPQKATCGNICKTCYGLTSVFVTPPQCSVPVYGTQQVNLYYVANGGSQYNITGGSNWSSNAISIATVQTMGQTYPGKATGVSLGNTYVFGRFTDFIQVDAGNNLCWQGAEPPCPQAQPANSCPIVVGPSGPSATLSCTPSSVTRGNTVTCTVNAPGATISNWRFTDGSNRTVTRSTQASSTTWSGKIATGGTISVIVSTMAQPLTYRITVNKRTSFAFAAVTPTKRSNPYISASCNIGVPTTPNAGNAVGYSCLDQQFFETPYLIGDNGPNHGYRYVYSASSGNSGLPTTFNFIVADYVDNSGSEFAQKQCGNYNPSTNDGFISYAQLKSNNYEHESGNTTGHYATYKLVQDNPANNIGAAVEAVVGPPGQTESDFNKQVLNVASSKGNAITTAAFPAPETLTTFCNSDVRRDPACVFRGYINWPVYASCQ